MTIYTETFPPYNYQKGTRIKGICADVVKRVQQSVNSTDPIMLVSWNRGYTDIQKKKNHALFCMVRLKEREELFKWVGPISEDKLVFYEHKDRPAHISSLEDAKKVESISTGGIYNADTLHLKSLGFTNIVTYSDVIQTKAVMPLVGKRVMLAVGNPYTTPLILMKKKIPSDTLVNTGVYLYKRDMYIAFSKDVEDSVIFKWQMALDGLKESGKLQQIQEDALRQAFKDYDLPDSVYQTVIDQ